MDNKTILIVEDDRALMEVLEEKLSIQGFSVLTAFNGRDGLTIALDKKPDLILLDIVMPVMSGIEMLEKLRGDEVGKEMTVVILTNLHEREEYKIGDLYPDVDYVIKSNIELEQVVDMVTKKLS